VFDFKVNVNWLKSRLVLASMYYLNLYLCTLLAFFAIDMVWLGLVARGFYQKHLGCLAGKWLQ